MTGNEVSDIDIYVSGRPKIHLYIYMEVNGYIAEALLIDCSSTQLEMGILDLRFLNRTSESEKLDVVLNYAKSHLHTAQGR